MAQGIGQVLGEQVVYGEDGQLLTASFMDYFMPRAGDVPPLSVHHHVVPCTTNPLGAKGAGESGVAGSLPSAVNAVLDALARRGVSASRSADDAATGVVGAPASPSAGQ